MNKNNYELHSNLSRSALSISILFALALPGTAAAMTIDTGNRDLSIRWDNSVRYNLGIRAGDCDKDICGDGTGRGDITAHQSDRKFDSAGDVVTNRLDLVSQFDVVYKDRHGFRVSGTAWYDHAYRDSTAEGDPALLAGGNAFPDGSYTGYVDRWNHGPSGEILDAFLFTGFDIGDIPVEVKVGQHNIYWGESIFSLVGGVSYSQGPVDFRKAQANPGTEAQELFKPLNQVSFSASVTPEFTLAGQYLLDWKPTSLPDGGTYFGPADFFSAGGGTVVPFMPAIFDGTKEPKDKRGDWGLAATWGPNWLDGTMGLYYREYTDKFSQMVIGRATAGGIPVIELDYQTPRQKLFGLSLSKQIGSIAFATEVTYRKDAQLTATPFSNVIEANASGEDWRPTGDVWTALANMVAFYGETPLFDSASLTAEVNYSNLSKVTNDPRNLYYGRTANCGSTGVATNHGCPTRDAWGMAASFVPVWYQAWSGVDLSMPMFLGLGLDGNSPVAFGDTEGQGTWSVGLSADVRAQYKFAIQYNGFLAKHSDDHLGMGGNSNSSLGKYWDRDWVSFTFNTAF